MYQHTYTLYCPTPDGWDRIEQFTTAAIELRVIARELYRRKTDLPDGCEVARVAGTGAAVWEGARLPLPSRATATAPVDLTADQAIATLAEAFAEYEGPGALYRAIYKWIECGPSVGMRVEQEYEAATSSDPYDTGTHAEWVYSDNLRLLGRDWGDLLLNGWTVTHLSVGSIVEGTEATTETIEIALEGKSASEVHDAFYAAVVAVDKEADEIWMGTHGCKSCATHWKLDPSTDTIPVWPDCPTCHGDGVAI